jgi:tripartite-type tricarboxylate transporter receptor subunit TctC
MVIPFAPGGANDVIGRLVGMKLTEALGQQVIVENRGGAGGSIGADLIAKAPPDGYNLLLGNIANLSVNPTLYRKLPYHPLTDFQPITLIAKIPNILAVHPSLPVRSVKDLIALAKAKPGSLAFGTGGSGSGSHLTAEYFKLLAKVDMVHVPYKGVGPALVDLLAGQTSLVFAAVPGVASYIKAGRLRALGVSSAKRLQVFPEVPTIEQAGVPGFEATLWYGVLAPAGPPAPIVTKLHATLVRALQTSDMRERLAADGSEPVGNTPEEFLAFIKSEIGRWAPVIKASGARVD